MLRAIQKMDKATAKYILNYYSHFMTPHEARAWKHHSSTIKLSGKDNPNLAKMYRKKGWLTEDKAALDLLKEGWGNFELTTAERILTDEKEKIFFNMCPKCRQLARTPTAKQCRHCGLDWHNKK